jgi:hypothetical protein
VLCGDERHEFVIGLRPVGAVATDMGSSVQKGCSGLAQFEAERFGSRAVPQAIGKRLSEPEFGSPSRASAGRNGAVASLSRLGIRAGWRLPLARMSCLSASADIRRYRGDHRQYSGRGARERGRSSS